MEGVLIRRELPRLLRDAVARGRSEGIVRWSADERTADVLRASIRRLKALARTAADTGRWMDWACYLVEAARYAGAFRVVCARWAYDEPIRPRPCATPPEDREVATWDRDRAADTTGGDVWLKRSHMERP